MDCFYAISPCSYCVLISSTNIFTEWQTELCKYIVDQIKKIQKAYHVSFYFQNDKLPSTALITHVNVL